MTREKIQKLISAFSGFKVVLSNECAPLLPLFVFAVEPQQSVYEIQVVRKTLMRDRIQSEVQLCIKTRNFAVDEFVEIFFGLGIVELCDQVTRKSLKFLGSLLPHIPSRQTVVPSG